MEAKISVLWFLIVFCIHTFKCDISFQSLLRKMRFIRKEKYQPGFDERVPLKIKATKESVVFLVCIVKNIGNETVSWIRHKDLQILTVDNYVFTGDKRFEVLNETPGNWTLKINNIQVGDGGIYECQISAQPIISFPVYLLISDPQKSDFDHFTGHTVRNNEEKENTGLVNDAVAELYKTSKDIFGNTRILEGSEIYLGEGDTLQLTCEVNMTQQPNQITSKSKNAALVDANLVWFHDNEIVSQNTSRDGTSVITKNSSRITYSRLLIFNTIRNDSGNYACFPFSFDEAIVRVHISSGSRTRVPTNILMFTLLTTLLTIYKKHYLFFRIRCTQ